MPAMQAKSIRSQRKKPWEKTLGDTVRFHRRALKLTQVELADLAGCGPAFLYQLETGKRSLRLDKVIAVLQVLGLQVALERGQEQLVVR